jgi:hypothetical protein
MCSIRFFVQTGWNDLQIMKDSLGKLNRASCETMYAFNHCLRHCRSRLWGVEDGVIRIGVVCTCPEIYLTSVSDLPFEAQDTVLLRDMQVRHPGRVRGLSSAAS